MPTWFEPAFTRFECCRYTANRVVSVRKMVKFDDNPEPTPVWTRGIYASKPEHIAFIDRMFEPESYNMYVSGFTFAWNRFNADVGFPPSYSDRHGYADWYEKVFTPNFDRYINNKDVVFEVDRNEGKSLSVAGNATLDIHDGLAKKGIKHHILFSGSNGYHTVIEDGMKLFDEMKVNLMKSDKSETPSAAAYSYAAILVAQKLLAEIYPKEIVHDEKGRGRKYGQISIHFSPMYPQGLRKAAYSLTEKGTVVLPIIEQKLLLSLPNINNESPFLRDTVMKNYVIKGRGWAMRT